MRDPRFIAVHRGGLLQKAQHYQLIEWARSCVCHGVTALHLVLAPPLVHALEVAQAWGHGEVSVGLAQKAAVLAHAYARQSANPVEIAIARAVGHTAAAAHCADHALGGALYTLKAFKYAGASVAEERAWQNDQLPFDIRERVLALRAVKEPGFKDLREG